MTATLTELAALVGGTLQGDGTRAIHGAATLRDATANDITLADNDKALKQLSECQAAAVVISHKTLPPAHLPAIQVPHVAAAFATIVNHFRPRRQRTFTGISPAARISPTAKLSPGCVIHAAAIIGDDVEIGPQCEIHSGAVLMAGCKIGARTTIYPHVVLYEDTIVGEECILHAGAVLGAHGFGYSVVNGRHELSAQLGYVELAARVEVGACTTIDRGAYGATYIGEGTKIDNQVQIAHNCKIGKHNLICAQVGIAGSVTTGDYVVFAGQVGVRDHVTIAAGVQLGAKSGVINDMHEPGQYVGQPATPEREYFQCLFGFAKLPELRKQFKQLVRDVEELKRGGDGQTRLPEAA